MEIQRFETGDESELDLSGLANVDASPDPRQPKSLTDEERSLLQREYIETTNRLSEELYLHYHSHSGHRPSSSSAYL